MSLDSFVVACKALAGTQAAAVQVTRDREGVVLTTDPLKLLEVRMLGEEHGLKLDSVNRWAAYFYENDSASVEVVGTHYPSRDVSTCYANILLELDEEIQDSTGGALDLCRLMQVSMLGVDNQEAADSLLQKVAGRVAYRALEHCLDGEYGTRPVPVNQAAEALTVLLEDAGMLPDGNGEMDWFTPATAFTVLGHCILLRTAKAL